MVLYSRAVGCCRVAGGLPGCCRVCCRTLPGVAGYGSTCCPHILTAGRRLWWVPGCRVAGYCRVLPGTAGYCRVAGSVPARVGAGSVLGRCRVGAGLGCRVAGARGPGARAQLTAQPAPRALPVEIVAAVIISSPSTASAFSTDDRQPSGGVDT
jgi:hypothetical protein